MNKQKFISTAKDVINPEIKALQKLKILIVHLIRGASDSQMSIKNNTLWS